MSEPQSITKISVANFKGIRGTIDLEPEGRRLLVIAGPNGSGKSSFIGAIEEVFSPSGTRLTPKPINDDADDATVTVVTSQAKIVRTWKRAKDGSEDAGTLTAFALDGAKYPSGKQFVLDVTGGAIFDASEFVNMDAKGQRAELLARVELPFDLAQLDAQRAETFDTRTAVNRDAKAALARLNAAASHDPAVPSKEVSMVDVLAEADRARVTNWNIDETIAKFRATEHQVEMATSECTRLAALVVDAQRARGGLIAARDAAAEEVRDSPTRIDIDAITAKLATLEATNAQVRQQAERVAIKASHTHLTEQETALTGRLADIDKRKADGLAAAVFPVPGLSVDDDGITFEGIPFKQVNTAKKIGIAFDLMTQATPNLRLVIIKDGDALDADSLAGIQAIAEARDYYVLVERDRDESRAIASAVFRDGVSA